MLNAIVIFVAGTGHPYFTTDTTAALRGAEMNVDIVMKGTKEGKYADVVYARKGSPQPVTAPETPGEGEIREALSGHLCRCTGYQKIVEAVQLAADLAGSGDG